MFTNSYRMAYVFSFCIDIFRWLSLKKGNGEQGTGNEERGMGNEERGTGNEVNHFPRNFA